jgi:parvulin-like peptidyl-prolyl isomerase
MIQTAKAFHLVKLEKVVPADEKGFETAAAEIRKRLQQALSQESMMAFQKGLLAEADITTNPKVLDRF